MDFNTMFKKADEIINGVINNLDGIDFEMFQSIVGMIVDCGCAKYGEDNVETLERICEVQKLVMAECGKVEAR